MKKNVGLIALLLGALVIGLGTLAFAWDIEDSETAKQDFCTSLTALSSTVMSYEGLNPATATNDELNAAADDIEDAWEEVVDDGYDWVYAYDNELTQAYDDLYYAIEDLDGDATVAESLEALEDELAAFPEAYSETFDGSGCTTA